MKREIREKRESLRKSSVNLRESSNATRGKEGFKIRDKQEEVYKRWKFYDNIIKANDKIKNK